MNADAQLDLNPAINRERGINPAIADKYAGKVKVMKLNVDENKQLANRFQVQSIPTFILFDGGQPVERFSGSNPTRIEDMIREALYVE